MKVFVNRPNFVAIPVMLTLIGLARMDILFHDFIKHPLKKTGTLFEALDAISLGRCFGFCTARVGCSSLAYSNAGNICHLSEDRHLTSDTNLASGWDVYGVIGELGFSFYGVYI